MTLSPYTQQMNPDVQVQLAKLGAALERAAYWLAHPDAATSVSEVGRLIEQYGRACERADIRFIDPTIGELHRQRNTYRAARERVDRDELDDDSYVRKYHRARFTLTDEFVATEEDVQLARAGEFWEKRFGPKLDAAEASRLEHLREAQALGEQLAKAQLQARTLLAEHAAADADVRRAAQFGEHLAINAYLDRDRELQDLLGVPT